MARRPKDIGTAAETAVVRALRTLGFPAAERRALTGSLDQGDVTGTPGIAWEVKGGAAAQNASDHQIGLWLAEAEVEALNAGAHFGILVVQRRGIGPANAHRWWAVLKAADLATLMLNEQGGITWGEATHNFFVRALLGDVCRVLCAAGYGQTVAGAVAV